MSTCSPKTYAIYFNTSHVGLKMDTVCDYLSINSLLSGYGSWDFHLPPPLEVIFYDNEFCWGVL